MLWLDCAIFASAFTVSFGGSGGGKLYEGARFSLILSGGMCLLDWDSWSGNVAPDKLDGERPSMRDE